MRRMFCEQGVSDHYDDGEERTLTTFLANVLTQLHNPRARTCQYALNT